MEKPLLSIVVPTKDRYKYLKYLVKYVFELNDPLIELIIQDNTAENSEIVDFLPRYQSKNIKYFHSGSPLTINENSDLAVKRANGKYVCYIGDDDAFLPNIIEYVNKMNESNVEAGIFPRPRYIWPDIDSKKCAYSQSNFIDHISYKEHEVNPQEEVYKLLRSASVSMLNLPHLYHGIVLKTTLDKIYERCDTFFPGPSPDMANAIALAFVCKKVYYYDYPLIIAGTGYSRIKGNERGDHQKLENLTFLPKNTVERWHPGIPKVWTIPTIFAQTSYIAIQYFNKDLFKVFNWIKFYTIMGFNFPSDTVSYISRLRKSDQIQIRLKIFIQKVRSKIGNYVRPLINRQKVRIPGENRTATEYAMNIHEYLKN